MKLNEALSISSIERFIDRRKVSMAAGTVASAGIALTGVAIPLAILAGIASGGLGAILDMYLNGKKFERELEKMNILAMKRETIISSANKSAHLRPKYIKAVTPALKRLKHDIEAISSMLMESATKAKAKLKNPDDIKKIDKTIKAIKEIKDHNHRPLNESQISEAVALLPVAFVAVMYMRDKLSVKSSYRKIEKLYRTHIDRNPDEYFHKAESFVWGYLTDVATHYYRGFLSKEEFEQQSDLVINIINTKDLSIIFNGKS